MLDVWVCLQVPLGDSVLEQEWGLWIQGSQTWKAGKEMPSTHLFLCIPVQDWGVERCWMAWSQPRSLLKEYIFKGTNLVFTKKGEKERRTNRKENERKEK